jgi:hypothetical protein
MAGNFLPKVQKAADKVRAKLAAKGFFEFTVTVTPSIPGNLILGTRETLGTPIALNPGVEVKKLSEGTVAYSAGVLITGDIELSGVSRLFAGTEAATATLVNNLSNVWAIDGPGFPHGLYTLISGQARRDDTAWLIRLRRKGVQP